MGTPRKPCEFRPTDGHVYVHVKDEDDDKWRHLRIGEVILTAAYGPCPKGYDLHHRDGNKENNSLGNLKWRPVDVNEIDHDTPSKNIATKHERELIAAGEMAKHVDSLLVRSKLPQSEAPSFYLRLTRANVVHKTPGVEMLFRTGRSFSTFKLVVVEDSIGAITIYANLPGSGDVEKGKSIPIEIQGPAPSEDEVTELLEMCRLHFHSIG